MTPIMEHLAAGEILILDGAMGTEVQKRGAAMDEMIWCAGSIRTSPEIVRATREDYIRAGANVIIANTFGSGPHTLVAAGLADEVEFYNRRPVELAREAREHAAERPVWIAGSVSSMCAGIALEHKPGLEDARASYRQQAEILAEAGVDFIMFELMMDRDYARAAAEAATVTGLPVWVGFSCRIDEAGEVRMFREAHSDPDSDSAFAEVTDDVMATGGVVAGIMHTELAHVDPALDVLKRHWSGPLMVYAEDGYEGMPIDWGFHDLVLPDDYAALAKRWVGEGVQAIGGCCCLGVEHIAALKRTLPAFRPGA